MADRERDERHLFGVVSGAMRRWLERAKDAVMAPWQQYQLMPDPTAIYRLQPAWNAEVETILTEIGKIGLAAWNEATEVPPVSRHAFVVTYLAQVESLLVRIPDEVADLIFAEITDGVNAGESVDQVAARVDHVLSYTDSERWPNRARTVAVTETTRAYGAGTLAAGMEQSRVTGRVLRKRWDTEGDEKVRGAHREIDGAMVNIFMPFYVDRFPMMFPGDPTAPAELVVNCVPGSSLILARDVDAVFRFKWEGSVLTLIGELGARTAVSPNHPVLTEQGWLLACELQKGDYIFSTWRMDSLTRGGPHVEYEPTTAEEIYRSTSLLGVAYRMEGLSVNFYGERPIGDIDVVLTNRELSFGLDPQDSEIFSQFSLSCAYAPCASESILLKSVLSERDPPDGIVGFDDLVCSLGRSHPSPLHSLGFAPASSLNTGPLKPEVDSSSCNPQTMSESIDGLALEVAMDKIIQIYEHPFSGHLYTFQTRSGIYVADQVVSHNCRCDLVIVNEEGR